MADIPKNQIRSRNTIEQHEHEDKASARRVVNVDPDGNPITTQNPLPVVLTDGSVNIGTVNAELEVQLSHKADNPDAGDVPDSVRIGDGDNELKLNPDGSTKAYEKLYPLLVNANFLKLGNFDKVTTSLSGDTTTLSYYESLAKIAEARFRFIDNTDWDIELEAYVNNDDGEILEEDSGELLLLE